MKTRIYVFRSNKYIYGQVIDPNGKTILSVSDKDIKDGTKVEKAREIGKILAKKALEKKIEKIIFDRGRFRYHGRVKALAEGAREGGLKF